MIMQSKLTAVLALFFTLCCLLSCQEAEGTTEQLISYVGIGYDILKGNPEADLSRVGLDRGGLDRGYRESHNILKRTYNENKKTTFQGRSIRLPDQMSYQPSHSCSSIGSTRAFSGTKSYQKKLDTYLKVSGGGGGLLWKYRFSASLGYSEVRSRVQSRRTVILDNTVTCNVGTIRYLTVRALNTDYSISNEFYYAVKNLPKNYDRTKYIEFIRTWGTHFVEKVTLGGRRIKRARSTYQEIYEYALKNVQSSVDTSGLYSGYSGSLSVDIDKFNEKVSNTAEFGSDEVTIASGVRIVEKSGYYEIASDNSETPTPIAITLVPLTIAFDERLWTDTPEGLSYSSLNIANKFKNFERARDDYPIALNAIAGSDPKLQIPTWPDGTYSMPMHKISGCPKSSGFTWKTGYVYQDNENTNNANYCPQFEFQGFCNRNLKVHYCSKTTTTGDFGIKWPKGSYCIVARGNCPTGFRRGSICWDDEDRRNRNKISGVVPSGNYNRDFTSMRYCCREDSHPHNPIILPTGSNFFLLKFHRDGCQEVTGMNVAERIVRTDDENKNNRNGQQAPYPYGASGRNHRLTYCSYRPQ